MSGLGRADRDSFPRGLDENAANQFDGRIASLFVAFGIAPGLLLRLGRSRGQRPPWRRRGGRRCRDGFLELGQAQEASRGDSLLPVCRAPSTHRCALTLVAR